MTIFFKVPYIPPGQFPYPYLPPQQLEYMHNLNIPPPENMVPIPMMPPPPITNMGPHLMNMSIKQNVNPSSISPGHMNQNNSTETGL